VQEALRNCVKHSGASLAKVTLAGSETEIRLTVSDDGCGLDMTSKATQRGLGFTSMKERLGIVDGKIEIHSQPGCGTVIKASVPLPGKLETVN
jgi:two-component system NarL family sensor kinase